MTKRKHKVKNKKDESIEATIATTHLPVPILELPVTQGLEDIPILALPVTQGLEEIPILELPIARELEETPKVSFEEAVKSLNYAGILIANEKRKEDKGTLGGVLVSDKGVHYGVTCFHVVKQDNKNFNMLLPEESVVVVSEKGNKIGVFNPDTAFINSKLDIALIELTEKFNNKTIDSPTKFVDINDIKPGIEVYFFNDRIKTKVKGVIRKVNQKGNWRLGRYENTIFVSNVLDDELCERISDEGDSGSWLLRVSDNALVGVIFANSFTSTFVMPITEVIDAFKKKNITLTLNILT